jgi:large subunit ribosomal protein L25
MQQEIVVSAESRDVRGKNEARRLRAKGRIPAVLYAPTKDASAISVAPRDLVAVFKTGAAENTLIDLEMAGKRRKVILKEYQVHPVRSELIHADFYEVALDKALHVKVHIELHGVPVGVKTQGGFLEFVTREVMVSCLPLDIPAKFTVNISNLELNKALRVSDLTTSDKVRILTDGDQVVAHVVTKAAEVEAPAADAAAVAAPAEPEVMKKGKAPVEGGAADGAKAPKEKDAKKDKK